MISSGPSASRYVADALPYREAVVALIDFLHVRSSDSDSDSLPHFRDS